MTSSNPSSRRARKKNENPGKNMTLTGHLADLRNCLVISVLSFLAAAIICFYFAPDFIVYAMSRADGYMFIQTGVAELMAQYIKVALIAGLVFASPIIIWQVEKFVGPALKKSEERKFLGVLIGGLVLFLVGAMFANFIVIPFTLRFFLNLNTIDIGGYYSIKEYISYLVAMLFSFGLVFEIPVVVAILSSFGLMKPQWMKVARRYVIVACVLVGAVITPPDITSQIMVAIPMYILFEISIVICTVIYRSRCKKLIAEGLDPDEVEALKKEERESGSRWAMAKSIVERKDQEKKKDN